MKNFIIILLILSGILAGYLINYLADVLPQTRKLGRVKCLQCSVDFTWKNYLLFRTCPACGHKRSIRNWIVVLFSPAAAVILYYLHPEDLGFYLSFLLIIYFSLVMITDIEYRLILQPVSIAGALITLLIGFKLHGWKTTLLGGGAGFLIMLVLYYLGELFARWLSKRRGQEIDEVALGFGDVSLSVVLGLLLGWPGIIAGLISAIFLAGFYSGFYLLVSLLRKNYRQYTAIPYAPFLIIGSLLLIFR